MPQFLQQNWIAIVLVVAMLAMHFLGHRHGGRGGHGGHGGHMQGGCGGGHAGHVPHDSSQNHSYAASEPNREPHRPEPSRGAPPRDRDNA